MAEPGRPGAQDADVRPILHAENAARFPRKHHVGVAQCAQCGNRAASPDGVGDRAGPVQHDLKLPRFRRVDDSLGMGGDNELRTLPRCRRPQLMVDRVLENDMQMRVRLAQQKHRARSRVEKRQQHQNLLESAAAARDVRIGTRRARRFRDPVFCADVRAARVRGKAARIRTASPRTPEERSTRARRPSRPREGFARLRPDGRAREAARSSGPETPALRSRFPSWEEQEQRPDQVRARSPAAHPPRAGHRSAPCCRQRTPSSPTSRRRASARPRPAFRRGRSGSPRADRTVAAEPP